MRQGGWGLAAMLAAGAVWGLSPLYWSRLNGIPAAEVLAHRTLWSLLVLGGLLLASRQAGALRAAWASRWRLLLSAVAISANWFGYILAIQLGRTTDSSLGYYLFPLMAGATGWLVLRESFGALQAAGFGLAALAVAILTVAHGSLPGLALFLGASFTLYGFLKRDLGHGALVTLTAEMLWLAPLALVWIAAAELWGWGGPGAGAFGGDLATSLTLAFSGLITGLPLVMFAHAAQRLSYATLGLAQYLNPTLQVCCAVLAFGEPFSAVQAVAFGLIWGGIALYAAGSFAQDRRRAIRDSASAGVATAVK